MLNLGGAHRVFQCVERVDFRKAHDGLCALVSDVIKDDPFSGDVFVFHNGARDRIKLLVWDRNGFWLLIQAARAGDVPLRGAARGGAGRDHACAVGDAARGTGVVARKKVVASSRACWDIEVRWNAPLNCHRMWRR